MINLMSQGGTPELAMFLAGHDNEVMSMHYASNISTMIECKTYRLYREMTKQNTVMAISSNPEVISNNTEEITLSDGGSCNSIHFKCGDIRDCIKAIGPDSEIGYCPVCLHYRKKGDSRFTSNSIFERNVTDRCRELIKAVNDLRKERGCPETVGELLLKLKDASLSYQQYLLEKKMEEDNGEK